MAKKNVKKVAAESEVDLVTTVVDQPVETPTKKWEVKDRTYFLKGATPVARIIKGTGIYWFDEEKGYERELMLTSNQRTVFVDEMQGVKRPEHIVFRDGVLKVPKNKVILQKLLSLYHPLIGKVFEEYKPYEEAIEQVDDLELQLKAMNAASNADIDVAEAIMRAEIGSEVSKMSSKEVKRDLLVFANENPQLFLDLMDDDNIHLRNLGIKATESGLIKLSADNRAFTWGSNDRKLMTVPFDEHPYSALAAWFKTDEGMEVLKSIEKRFK